MSRQSGATLVELILVLALTAVIAGAASLSMSALEKRKLRNAALELQSVIRYAQRMSMAENTSYQVSFYIADRFYRIRRIPAKPGDAPVDVVLEQGVAIYSADMSGGRYITFTPKGTTGSAGTVKLRSAGYNLDVTVNVGAGKVTVKDIEKLKK